MTSQTIPRWVFALLLFMVPGLGVQAAIIYTATLSGSNEEPENDSPGSGFATVAYDPVAHTLQVDASFADLVQGTTAAHIHCCTATPLTGTVGVASATPTFPGFPTGVTSGTYSNLFDLTEVSSFSAGFVTESGGTVDLAEAALAAGLAEGRAYFNIHSSAFPAGEIRGFLTAVPLPAAAWLFAGGLAALFAVVRRSR
jgi:hypothetical protein